MNAPLVSVIIPCRNEENFIRTTISSLLNQKGFDGNIEIIVVDGKSSDKTREIICEMKLENENLYLVINEKQITPIAMNLGIKAAKGKYIAIMGAHTEYDQNYLSECLKLFNKYPLIGCTGGSILSVGKSNFGKAAAAAMSHPIGVGNAKHRFPNYEGYAEGAAFPVFKKEVFDKIGLYDERLIKNQDDDFNFRLTKSGYKVYISPKAKCKYYVRERPIELFRQYFDYGYWRMATIKKHKLPVSFRQLVPALFLFSILFFIGIGFLISAYQLIISIFVPAIYLLVIFGSDIKVMKQNGLKTGMFFPAAVITLHFAYGLGFIKGLKFLFTKGFIKAEI